MLRDVQNERDHRNLPIDKVGIKGLRYPITVLDRANREQPTVATVNLYVGLPREFRGTHMSRFVEIINKYRWRIHSLKLIDILNDVMDALPSHSAHIEVFFPFFIKKRAPVSGEESLMSYDVAVYASLFDDKKHDLVLEVNVPVMTLCPCSKEISSFGAHNQRCMVKVALRFNKLVWIEEVIGWVEDSASCDLYALLKREDEKFVTESAYENPVFVEDLVRDVVLKLKEDSRICWFRVEAESLESIHLHNAYACIEMSKT